jgi:menaquinone-dependent protoporphyrinogen IX oxidase
MKIGIVFATKREGATQEIARWMEEHLQSLGHTVVAARPADFSEFDCDFYLLGTAVYAFSAKRAGLPAFIRRNRSTLQGSPTGVFIVCGVTEQMTSPDDGFVKRTLKNAFLDRRKYMASIVRLLPKPPVSTVFFQGYQEPEDRLKIDFPSQQQQVVNWCSSLGI